jgi:hypothetical protein
VSSLGSPAGRALALLDPAQVPRRGDQGRDGQARQQGRQVVGQRRRDAHALHAERCCGRTLTAIDRICKWLGWAGSTASAAGLLDRRAARCHGGRR